MQFSRKLEASRRPDQNRANQNWASSAGELLWAILTDYDHEWLYKKALINPVIQSKQSYY
jgi:hypothetical protein